MRTLAPALALALALALVGCFGAEPDPVVFNSPYVTLHSYVQGAAEDGAFVNHIEDGNVQIVISFTAVSPAGPGDTAACAGRPDHLPRVEVRDPAGDIRASAVVPATPSTEPDCGMDRIDMNVTSAKGAWRVHLEGQGNVIASVGLM